MAATDRTRYSYKPEATYGVPVTASACYGLRTNSDSLNYALNYKQSNNLNPNRVLRDNILTGADASGSIPFDMVYGEYDWFLSAVLQGNWSVYGTNGVGSAFTATFAANKVTAGSAPNGNSAFTNLSKGQWIKIAGSSNDAHNIWVQVSKSVDPTGTEVTFEGTPFTGQTGSGGAAVTISASRLVNGTTLKSASIERYFSDDNKFKIYRGMIPNVFNLNFTTEEILTGSFDFIGKDAAMPGATSLHATVTDSLNSRTMNATSGLTNMLEGGASLGTYFNSLTLSYNNNNRAKKAIGVMGNFAQGQGQIDLKLSGSLYFKDETIYNKMVNSTDTDFSFRINDPLLNGYVFTIPAGNYTSYSDPVQGKNNDVMCDFEITAKDNGSSQVLIIDRAGSAITLPT